MYGWHTLAASHTITQRSQTHVHKNFIGFWCELNCKAIQRTRYYRSRSQLQYPNCKITFHGNTAAARTRKTWLIMRAPFIHH